MTEITPRLSIPYIRAAQAQKEVTHNEALNILDALVQAVVEDRDLASPPITPAEGQVWIVASGATGDWEGEEGNLACFIGGGWIFLTPADGFRVWLRDEALEAFHDGTGWTAGEVRAAQIVIGGEQVVGARQAAIADAESGTTVDSEARTALNALLAACRAHGLISS